MRLVIAFLSAALALAGCGAAPDLRVDGAWVRLPAVAGRPGAAYFALHGGPAKATLLAVSSPAVVRAELHESMAGTGGMMAMAPLAQVDVPAGGTIAFAPGGRHVMLFDVSPALKAGSRAELRLKFADGTTLRTQARVVGAGDDAPTGD